jgi:uncharacterized membrane protein
MIVNNQLGFTTGGVGRNRSSRYSSDIGKIISMPVLHVNADAPESVAYAARMALAFQRHFHRDIMVDLIGYRKHGHNEVDEPSFTQPLMYKDIRSRANIVKLYRESLTKAGVFSEGTDPDAKLVARLTAHLEKELAEAPTYKAQQDEHFQGKWKGIGQPKDVEDGQNNTARRCADCTMPCVLSRSLTMLLSVLVLCICLFACFSRQDRCGCCCAQADRRGFRQAVRGIRQFHREWSHAAAAATVMVSRLTRMCALFFFFFFSDPLADRAPSSEARPHRCASVCLGKLQVRDRLGHRGVLGLRVIGARGVQPPSVRSGRRTRNVLATTPRTHGPAE